MILIRDDNEIPVHVNRLSIFYLYKFICVKHNKYSDWLDFLIALEHFVHCNHFEFSSIFPSIENAPLAFMLAQCRMLKSINPLFPSTA